MPAAFSAATQDKLFDALRHGIPQAELLQACRDMNPAAAVALIVAGIIFLMWGYYSFKILVTLNSLVIGGWIGGLIGDHAGAPIPAALIGGFTAAAVTWPLMKYAVAVMGGLLGTIIGMAAWRGSGIDANFTAAGGCMGMIFFGLLSFILFRTCVMMFTSLQGSLMLIIGILAVLYKFNAVDATALDARLSLSPLIMPMTFFFPAVAGILYQNHHANGGGAEAKKK